MKKISTLLLTLLSFTAHAEETIRVYAASSMTNAITELSAAFTQSHDVKITPVFGGSSSLARQIERGAPADIFISANQKWVNHLVKQGTIKQDNVSIFASNSLVLISPKDSTVSFDVAEQSEWGHHLENQRLAIGQPDSVPAGIYSKEALKTLGVWEAVDRNLASTKNVRVALVLVELGEAPLGMVYKTDAMASEKVRIVHHFNDFLHSKIDYPLAKISNSPATEDFMKYLKSAQAKQILERYGFK
ncbi:molybdate ABC transporter substrate-binding protein [Vibrio profundi]|uniref:molybdate ABC transporter substrate-binding protein n=1 Tax=Vibrio profundi TaxID=1774960 RepID=UPI003735B298